MVAKAHIMLTPEDSNSGATLKSATCQVYNPGTVVQISATMYDKNGNVLSNPLTSDSLTGLIDAYLAVAQTVDLVISKSGYATQTLSNVPFLDDASLDLTSLLTSLGDMVYASATNSPARLGIGAANTLLMSAGGVPVWTAGLTLAASLLTLGGSLDVSSGQIGIGGAHNSAYAIDVQGSTVNVNFGNGSDVIMGTGSIANGATDGFPYMPYGGGDPSGTPTSFPGFVPYRYSHASHKLWIYDITDGAWKGVAVA